MNRETPRSPFVDDPLDRAVAEIAARQRALDGEGEAPLVPDRISPGPSPWLDAPRADLSGLEQQLRSLTTQIESIRRPCGVEDAVGALQDMDKLATRGVIVSDLHRTRGGYVAVSVLSRLFGNSVVQHDGPLSVRRAFRVRELDALAEEAGLPYLRVRVHHPWFRVSLAGEKV